jgi:hypothetical protein
MEIMNNGTATEIKEIFAQPTIACTFPLPVTNMSQGMFDRHTLTQFGSSDWCQLALASLDQ